MCVLFWLGFSSGKESIYKAGETGRHEFNPGPEGSPGGGHDNPLQYSRLENPMNTVAWWAKVHRVTKSDMTTEHAHTLS